ncbi:MAG: TIM barrel protein [Phycisphaerae bacterium]|nr:TIM barrel protein [Phycisphaerae bacterium]
MKREIDRRAFLGAGVAAAAAGGMIAAEASPDAARSQRATGAAQENATIQDRATVPTPAATPARGALRQSVARWCFGAWNLDTLCEHAKSCGLVGVDLLSENEWSIPAKHGLVCTLANGPCTIAEGFNRPQHHDRLVAECERLLPLVADAGIERMIVFSGNRAGMSDADGLTHCAAGLRRVMPIAERVNVTVVMELLNSKIDHRDHMCDRSEWGAALVRSVGSPRFKLLYDIYHAQIMEGDVIRTIRTHADAIGHYHTAGVPGRHELDDRQELQYDAICRAIADTGFRGVVAHEFLPRGDPLEGLRQAVARCTIPLS